ncbi:MAG: tetratricopeptide repeat protein, partial [Candidatus Aenigmarchaeota archaeon]|nr:tetratricopeptide repeat protein [Candidatus Aenigmarchaeota archaeon]
MQDEIAEFLNGMGILLGKEKKEYQEALLVFDAAIQLASSSWTKEKAAMNCSVSTHSILGNILRKRKMFDEAQFHLKEALRLSPRLSIAHSEYGYLLNLQKRYDEAEVQFEEALRLEPDSAQTHNDYAILLADLR